MRKSIAGLLLAFLICAVDADTRVVGYSYGTDPASTDFDLTCYTHVIASFVLSDSLGNLAFDEWIPESAIVALLNKARTAGAVPMIALGTTTGGWAMTQSRSARTAFVSNLVAWCQSNNVAGIDLDLEGEAEEFNWGNPGTFFPAPYESLAVELRAAMPDSMILSAAVGSFSRDGAQWTDRFIGALDFINVMVYDRALSWEESPIENHSTFDGQISAAAYWHGTRGLGKERINLGVPFYARAWDRDNNRIYREDGGWECSTWDYAAFVNRAIMPADQDTLDFPATDYIQYPRASGVTGRGTLFFNGSGMIARKTQWAVDSGYGGMMVWHLGGDVATSDSRSLLRAIDGVIHPSSSISREMMSGNAAVVPSIKISGGMISIDGFSSGNNLSWSILSLDGKRLFSGTVPSGITQCRIELHTKDLARGCVLVRVAAGDVNTCRRIVLQ